MGPHYPVRQEMAALILLTGWKIISDELSIHPVSFIWETDLLSIIQANFSQISILTILIIIGLFFTFKSIKPLIGNSLGVAYAQSFGVSQSKLKISIIVASSILSASVTAFLGPILFIGVVVPHFCRMLWNPAQLWHQLILNVVLGVFVMQVFSIISELSQFPINIITTFFGIPVILLMLVKKK